MSVALLEAPPLTVPEPFALPELTPEPEILPIPPTLQEVVQILLDQLAGLGADGIARLFADNGIKATPCNAGECALAQYLHEKTGDTTISVGAFTATAWRSGEERNLSWDLPPAVHRFVDWFDDLHYPELVSPDWVDPMAQTTSMEDW